MADFINAWFGNQVSYVLLSDLMFCCCIVFLFTRWKCSAAAFTAALAEVAALFLFKLTALWLFQLIPAVYDVISPYLDLYIICPLQLLLSACLLQDYRRETRIVCAFMFGCLYILCMGLTPNLLILLLRKSFAELGSIFLVSFTGALLVLPCVVVLKKWNVEAFAFLSTRHVFLITILSLIGFLASLVFNILLRNAGDIALFYVVFHLMFIGIELLLYLNFYQVSKQYNDWITEEVVSQKERAQNRMIEMTKNNAEELRRFRHDMMNHYSVMAGLLARKEYPALETYFSGLQNRIQELTDNIRTGNQAVDCILNTKYAEAREHGIRLEVKAAIPPSLPIDETRLCSLIFNLIDNALEAVERDQCENRYVYFSILQKGGQLFLYVRNPIAPGTGKNRPLLLSSKQDVQRHGYGIQIIRGIVAEYDGTISFHTENGCFIAEAMMKSDVSGR